jgi:hypothetical protein
MRQQEQDDADDQIPNRAVVDDLVQPANRDDLLARLEHGFGVTHRGDAPAVKSPQSSRVKKRCFPSLNRQVRRTPPRFLSGSERPPGAVPHDKGGGQIIDGLGRQEAGAMANWALASFKNGQF